jgi:PAS domain S-box-containing protein
MPASSLADALLQNQSDAIVATDRAGTITFWNPAAERIFGFASSEAVGKSLDIIIPENARKRHWDGFTRVMETGESRYGHGDVLAVPALTRDGRRISVEFTITLLFDDAGKPSGTAAIMRDVSKSFEEKLQLRKRVAELSRGA